MKKCTLKARLQQGESILGTMVTVFDSPELVKILRKHRISIKNSERFFCHRV